LNSRIEQIVALAAHHAIPVMYSLPEFIVVGGLKRLWSQPNGNIPTDRTLRGAHSQGREASRLAGQRTYSHLPIR
jgi:hypothetical protein